MSQPNKIVTFAEFKAAMESYRRDANVEAQALKDSYFALNLLRNFYKNLDEDDRHLADRVLADWLSSDDENLRFDALALINEFHILTALPALGGLAARLKVSVEPGARYELEKANRFISNLSRRAS